MRKNYDNDTHENIHIPLCGIHACTCTDLYRHIYKQT